MVTVMIPLFLGNIGAMEALVILLVVLLLFGGKKIPELMHGLGKGVAGFRKGINEIENEMKSKPEADSGKNENI